MNRFFLSCSFNCILQNLVHKHTLPSYLLLLVRHEDEDRFKNLIESLNNNFFKVMFVPRSFLFHLDLMTKKHKEKFKPLQSFQFGFTRTLRIGNFNKITHQLINKIDTNLSFQRIIIKFLFYNHLEIRYTLIHSIFYLVVATHNKQIF